MNDQATLWLTAALFTLTYIALAFGRVPGLRMDRAGIALVGATLMLVTGAVLRSGHQPGGNRLQNHRASVWHDGRGGLPAPLGPAPGICPAGAG